MLAAFGGGLGGLLFQLTDRPAFRCADLAVGYFPYLEALANPHWLLASWLLLETLLAYSAISRASDIARATALATALGLVRPYDLVLGGLVAGVAALAASPREGLRRGLALIGLVPVCAYNYWVFYRSGATSTFFPTSAYASPPSRISPGPWLRRSPWRS